MQFAIHFRAKKISIMLKDEEQAFWIRNQTNTEDILMIKHQKRTSAGHIRYTTGKQTCNQSSKK